MGERYSSSQVFGQNMVGIVVVSRSQVSCQVEVISGVMRPFSPKDDRGRGDKPPDDRPKDRGHEPPIEDSQGESSKTNKTRNQAKEQDQQVKKLPDHIAHDGPCPKVIRILHKPITTEPNTENQYSKKIKLSKDDLPSKKMLSRWEKLSQKEKDEEKKKMDRKRTNFEVLGNSPLRNTAQE